MGPNEISTPPMTDFLINILSARVEEVDKSFVASQTVNIKDAKVS
jgi:hypothetical protein